MRCSMMNAEKHATMNGLVARAAATPLQLCVASPVTKKRHEEVKCVTGLLLPGFAYSWQ